MPAYATRGSNPRLADPGQACCSHVEPCLGQGFAKERERFGRLWLALILFYALHNRALTPFFKDESGRGGFLPDLIHLRHGASQRASELTRFCLEMEAARGAVQAP